MKTTRRRFFNQAAKATMAFGLLVAGRAAIPDVAEATHGCGGSGPCPCVDPCGACTGCAAGGHCPSGCTDTGYCWFCAYPDGCEQVCRTCTCSGCNCYCDVFWCPSASRPEVDEQIKAA